MSYHLRQSFTIEYGQFGYIPVVGKIFSHHSMVVRQRKNKQKTKLQNEHMFGPNCQHPLTSFNHTHTHFWTTARRFPFLFQATNKRAAHQLVNQNLFLYQRPAQCTSLGCWKRSRFTLHKTCQVLSLGNSTYVRTTILTIGIPCIVSFSGTICCIFLFSGVSSRCLVGSSCCFLVQEQAFLLQSETSPPNTFTPMTKIQSIKSLKKYVKDVKFDFKTQVPTSPSPEKDPNISSTYSFATNTQPIWFWMLHPFTPDIDNPIFLFRPSPTIVWKHERSSTWKKKRWHESL